MAQKKRRHGKKASFPTWQTVLAIIVITVGIFWNVDDKESEPNQEDTCGTVMAASAIPSQHAGWGMFTLKSIPQGEPATSGEPVIQLTDLVLGEYDDDVSLMLDSYAWSASVGQGFSEGYSVFSMIPGAGGLANGHPEFSNIASYIPEVDNAGLTRDSSPGAGAITQYHNHVYRAKSTLSAGDELIVYYGSRWQTDLYSQEHIVHRKEVKELRETGICLDNIRPGQSTIVDAGRGAFATRALKKGSVIAPAPLITIKRREALMTRHDARDTNHQQLLLNYCFGHRNSSVLFFPYSPVVNLINHDSVKPNAELQWSQSPLHFGKEWLTWPLEQLKSLQRTGLLLEYVATRDIFAGEEIYIDYGRDWENAWNKHKAEWKPNTDPYKYPHQLEEEVKWKDLVTEADDSEEPYPDNVQVTCFYHYGQHMEEAAGESPVQWRLTPFTGRVSSQRPCRLLRKEMDPHGDTSYTAEIYNSAQGGDDNIPEGVQHIVTGIPREAIALTNKLYSSDQHLPNAFRHEIGIPDDIFPRQWMDRP